MDIQNLPKNTLSDGIVHSRAVESTLPLANAGELASAVIVAISGNDVASSINGSRITRESIQVLVYQRLLKKLLTQTN